MYLVLDVIKALCAGLLRANAANALSKSLLTPNGINSLFKFSVGRSLGAFTGLCSCFMYLVLDTTFFAALLPFWNCPLLSLLKIPFFTVFNRFLHRIDKYNSI